MSSDERLPVAVVGLGTFGRLTVQALASSSIVRLVGLADRDRTLAERTGREVGVPAYSDNRHLLAESRPAAVFLSVPPMEAGEILFACAERSIHVWKELPLGRNLEEAVALVRRMEKAHLKFAIGTQGRFAPGYRRAWSLREKLGPVFLGRAHYLFNWGPDLGWRGDKASCGGGALLELGYHPVDLLVWMLGLPEEVYGSSVGGNRPNGSGSGLGLYDTDDTAAAILRYEGPCMAAIVTTRSSGPVSQELSLHGRGGSLTARSESCLLRDPDGNVLDHLSSTLAPVDLFRRQAEAFARAVMNDERVYECSARENLLNQAVIEAIYLSDKTSQPESPSRLLKTHHLSPEQCLKYQPKEIVDSE